MQIDLDSIRDIVSDAVRGLLDGPSIRGDALAGVDGEREVTIPVRVADDADAARLVRMLLAICADPVLRERALAGRLKLDVRIAGAEPAEPAPAPPVRTGCGVSGVVQEPVITEAMLRRNAVRGQRLQINGDAVVTPSARDYARSQDIVLERRSQ